MLETTKRCFIMQGLHLQISIIHVVVLAYLYSNVGKPMISTVREVYNSLLQYPVRGTNEINQRNEG